jgi:hypothetical protein
MSYPPLTSGKRALTCWSPGWVATATIGMPATHSARFDSWELGQSACRGDAFVAAVNLLIAATRIDESTGRPGKSGVAADVQTIKTAVREGRQS